MGYLPIFELESFDTLSVPARKAVLMKALSTLAEANYHFLRERGAPALYDWAPKYRIKARPFSLDSWQDIPSTMKKGTGDCKDFAAWRVAELYLAGYTVGFHIKVQKMPPDLIVYHIQVEGFNRDGRFVREDPSKLLGMPTHYTQEQIRAIIHG